MENRRHHWLRRIGIAAAILFMIGMFGVTVWGDLVHPDQARKMRDSVNH